MVKDKFNIPSYLNQFGQKNKDLENKINQTIENIAQEPKHENYRQFLEKGDLQFFENNFSSALTFYNLAKQENPTPVCDLKIARCYTKIKHPENPIDYQKHFHATLKHFNTYLQKKKDENVFIEVIDYIRDTDEEKISIKGNEKAEKICKTALKYHPNSENLQSRLLLIYELTNKKEKAHKTRLDIARKANPEYIKNNLLDELFTKTSKQNETIYDILKKRTKSSTQEAADISFTLGEMVFYLNQNQDPEKCLMAREHWLDAYNKNPRKYELVLNSIRDSYLEEIINEENLHAKKRLNNLLKDFYETFPTVEIIHAEIEKQSQTALEKKKTTIPRKIKDIPSFNEIYEHMTKYVIGQEDALKKFIISAREHLKINKARLKGISSEKLPERRIPLIHGPPGVGKTLSIEVLGEYLNLPYWIASTDHLTEEGYIGDSLSDIFLNLYHRSNKNLKLMELGIIFFDEFDKLASKESNTRDVSGAGAQKNLLTILQGNELSIKNGHRNLIVNTKHMMFALGGSFAGGSKFEHSVLDEIAYKRLFDKAPIGFGCDETKRPKKIQGTAKLANKSDFKMFGILPEITDRVNELIYYQKLTEEDFKKILKYSKNSIIEKTNNSFGLDNIKLSWTSEAIDMIAERAASNQESARILKDLVFEIVEPLYYQIGEINEAKIDKEFIEKRFEDKNINKKY